MAIAVSTLFDKMLVGSGVTTTKDDWYDLSAMLPDGISPIPVGRQMWIGYATFVAEDKGLIFEVRPNLPTKSAATAPDTILRGYSSVLVGESNDEDFYMYGNILTAAPSVASTGVEKLWLRIRSGSAVSGAWDVIIYYTLI